MTCKYCFNELSTQGIPLITLIHHEEMLHINMQRRGEVKVTSERMRDRKKEA